VPPVFEVPGRVVPRSGTSPDLSSAVEGARAAVGADGTGRCDALVEHDGTPAIVSTKRKLDPDQPRTHW
jgi:hypothetical protein